MSWKGHVVIVTVILTITAIVLLRLESGYLPTEINNPPVSDFTYTRTYHIVNFVDNSLDNDGTIVGWKWEFGDNGISYEQNPTHSYYNRGIYEVKLTVTDNGGVQAICTKTITIPDTIVYTWEYETRNWSQQIEFVNEDEKYENMSHVPAYLGDNRWDYTIFVTPDDEIIKALAENQKAQYIAQQFGISEYGLANFVLKFVQEGIRYDWTVDKYHWAYPLETLIAVKGVCSQKSMLYASLIEALGYHASLFDLPRDNHTMVGVHLNEIPSIPSAGGYVNVAVEPFAKDGVEYWPAETTWPGWELGWRNTGLRMDNLSMQIYPIT
jgi:PKD repeat protein